MACFSELFRRRYGLPPGCRLRRPRDRGVTVVEYALVIALCSGAAIGALSALGGHSADALSSAAAAAPVPTTQGSGGGGGPGTTLTQVTSRRRDPYTSRLRRRHRRRVRPLHRRQSPLRRPARRWPPRRWAPPPGCVAATSGPPARQSRSWTIWANPSKARWSPCLSVSISMATGPRGLATAEPEPDHGPRWCRSGTTAGPYKWNTGKSQVTQVEFTAQAVTTSDGLPWDQSAPSVTIDKP